MATGGIEVTSDEIFNFKCTACAKRSRNREAVKYCVECQRYCCQACVDAHNDFPALVNHNLLDKSSFKSAVLTTDLPVVPTERCSVHETKILDMYCQNHDEVGCTTCMALDHRSCKDLHSIPDVIDNIFQKSDVEKTLQTLKDNLTSIRTVKKIRDELLQELKKSKVEAVKAIEDFRKEMERLLEDMEKESIKEVDNEFGKLESILTQDIQTAAKEEDHLQKFRNDLQKAGGNRAQVFVYMKIAQKKTESTEAIVRLLQTPTDAKVLFSANQEIINLLQQLKSLGSVPNARLSSFSSRKTLYAVNSTKEVNIRTQNDSDICNVYGSCLKLDGMLLIADFNNKKLKRVDMVKMDVVDQCKFPVNPLDVCCVSKQEAAVSLANNTIQFVSLGKQMKTTRQVKLNHYCCGIVYKDDKLYITDNGKSLYIHDMTGNMLQTVTKDNSGNDLFQWSKTIAFSDDGDKIFVANGKDGVVVLDAHGRYIDTFRDQNLNNTFGVCTDKRGNIFVCGNYSHNIVQMSQDGKERFGEVVKRSDAILYPYCVTFNPCGCTLINTQFNSDKIRLMDLQ